MSLVEQTSVLDACVSYQSLQPVRAVPQQAAHPAQRLLHSGLQVVSGPAGRGAPVRCAQRQAALQPLSRGLSHVTAR